VMSGLEPTVVSCIQALCGSNLQHDNGLHLRAGPITVLVTFMAPARVAD
jgi:hypothetical protein